MKLALVQILQLSETEVPTWDEAELLVVQLDDDALRALSAVARRIQGACDCEEEARTEGTSKRKDSWGASSFQ